MTNNVVATSARRNLFRRALGAEKLEILVTNDLECAKQKNE
jgi:hypothetical protein